MFNKTKGTKTPKTLTEHALTAAAWIGRGAYAIAVTGTVASYGTQVALLLAHEVGKFAYVIPATVDVLAICAAMALQLPGLDKTSRRIAGAILFVAVAVSATANLAGGHNDIARAAHAWPVVAYLLGELLANRVRAYANKLAATPVVAMVTQAAADAALAAAVASAQAQAAQDHAAAMATAQAETAALIATTEQRLRTEAAALVAEAQRVTRDAASSEAAALVAEAERVTRDAVAAELAARFDAERTAILAAAKSAARTAPATRTRREVTAKVAEPVINPRTGEPYSERHSRRLVNGR